MHNVVLLQKSWKQCDQTEVMRTIKHFFDVINIAVYNDSGSYIVKTKIS